MNVLETPKCTNSYKTLSNFFAIKTFNFKSLLKFNLPYNTQNKLFLFFGVPGVGGGGGGRFYIDRFFDSSGVSGKLPSTFAKLQNLKMV